jgi:thioesterase domain-containing protein
MNHQKLVATLSLAVLLGACGGGGGGPSDFGPPQAFTNTPPVADAGAAQSILVSSAVALDGSRSSDANGDVLSYAWTLTEKPAGSAATLANATSAKTGFSPDVAGVYTATLVVNDGRANGTNAATVRITASAINVVGPGQFMSAVHLKTVSAAEVRTALALDGEAAFVASPKYPVEAYRLTYMTLDGQGRQIQASGLVAIPQKPASAPSPVLSYQHATIKRQAEAPSALTRLGDPPVVLASLGYIVVAADYVGYGVSAAAPHPYLLSAPSASAVIDLLTAARYWRQTQGVPDNKQLFMTGYSEGGYVTMAAHRALQAGTSVHRNELVRVVAAAGPYDVALSLDQQLAKVKDANVLLGQLLSPGFLKLLGDSDRRRVRDLLLREVLGSDAEVTFLPTVIDSYLEDDRATLAAVASVYDWGPQVPVNLFHGREDSTVSYLNSSRALQAMQARGAANQVALTDCVAQPAGHSECILPYWRFVLADLARAARDL